MTYTIKDAQKFLLSKHIIWDGKIFDSFDDRERSWGEASPEVFTYRNQECSMTFMDETEKNKTRLVEFELDEFNFRLRNKPRYLGDKFSSEFMYYSEDQCEFLLKINPNYAKMIQAKIPNKIDKIRKTTDEKVDKLSKEIDSLKADSAKEIAYFNNLMRKAKQVNYASNDLPTM